MRIQQCSRPSMTFAGGGSSDVTYYIGTDRTAQPATTTRPEPTPYVDHAKATSMRDYWWLGPIPYWLGLLVRKPGK